MLFGEMLERDRTTLNSVFWFLGQTEPPGFWGVNQAVLQECWTKTVAGDDLKIKSRFPSKNYRPMVIYVGENELSQTFPHSPAAET